LAEQWTVLKDIPSLEVTRYVTAPSRMPALVEFTAEQIWVAIEARRQAASASAAAEPDPKVAEWQVLTQNPPPAPTKDFRVVRVSAPSGFGQFFEETVLLELLREVRALLAFTRIEWKGDFADAAYAGQARIYYWPLAHRARNQAGRPGKLHAKCAIVDDVAIIGSANLTDDAFNRNMELGTLVRGVAMVSAISGHFDELIRRGTLVAVRQNSKPKA
jgi:hypothetical protein